MWIEQSEFFNFDRAVWLQGNLGDGMTSLTLKIKTLKSVLKGWIKLVFGNIFQNIHCLEDRITTSLEDSLQDRWDVSLAEELKNVKIEREQVLLQEELYWLQKSNVKWLQRLQDRQSNTKFFHASVKAKRSNSMIQNFQLPDGTITSNVAQIHTAAIPYYESLLCFTEAEENPTLFECIPSLVTDADNSSILAPLTINEVKGSVFSIPKDCSLGPDGISSAFFRVVGTL
ncbi:hypothetical protein IFM89_022773 [Coptis chinensis]|uniref:Uncharacterized protein n=1 Tax=Coptis chinensis TaxID=261450 RepID=A0A835IPS3_9MAGN|nr:hypothetical protein IFM89_022773 [Coptis chinensis]